MGSYNIPFHNLHFKVIINRLYFSTVLDLQKNWVYSTEFHISIPHLEQYPQLLISCISVVYVQQLMNQYQYIIN